MKIQAIDEGSIDCWGSAKLRFLGPKSPFKLDVATVMRRNANSGRWFFDGVLKGDYSLAIVNRYLARSLIRSGIDLSLHSNEDGWSTDSMLNDMPDVRSRCLSTYPLPDSFDVHIRNTWPPRADDMIGSKLNAYVCFAWEERDVPTNIISHFNLHLDLIMVTSNFVEQSLRRSGITIPVEVVGNGTDHIFDFVKGPASQAESVNPQRVLHVSSCFPRKGADLLVESFTQTFSAKDNVELCIKTFDNPHNTIDRDVEAARLKRPDAAPVKVIKRSMSYPALVALMQSSKLLVAPSRGEGFGLPLAEAMLLGVPVVTTGYSGQTDFCSAKTAWLVDYTLVPSTAHVAKEGAVWAEPDLASLGQQMRRALNDVAASRAKLASAQALLKAHFKWSDVARRVCAAIGERLAAPRAHVEQQAGSDLRIDLVSTWGQVCGIATYSEHLFDAPVLHGALSNVFAREVHGDERPSPGGPVVSRPWSYDSGGIVRLAASLGNGCADVLWFQHHPGFFSNSDMTTLIAATQQAKYRVKAITLHNVRETIAKSPTDWLHRFDTVIVHTKADADLLANYGVFASVIPHGILAREAQRQQAGDEFTVGSFGFLYPHKNIPLLVEALALARLVEPRMRLRLLNCVRNDPNSHKERARVEQTIRALGLEDAVETDFRFLDDDEIIERLGQCDLLCFPYAASNESATGAARIAIAADRPLLCSQASVLHDILPLAFVLARVDAATLADALVTLAASPTIRTLRDAQRKTYIDRHSYPVVAEQHLKVLAASLKGQQ